MKNVILSLVFLFGVLNVHGQKPDTFQVYFPLNDSRISKGAGDLMDSLIFKDVLIHGQKLILLGYADYLGDNKYDEALSAARAKKVEDYLVSSGFDPKDITICIGKGKINRAPVNGKEGFAADRKVQIIIDRRQDSIAAEERHKNAPDLAHAKVNETVALKNISFTPGMDIILPVSFPELEKLYNFLAANKKVTIQIEGHICCVYPNTGLDTPYGSSTLSNMRAKAVYDYLVSKGIDKNRLKYVGLGNLNPIINPEITEEDRQQNRRVEVRILNK